MSDERDPLAWVNKAEEDWAMSRVALRYKKPLTSIACFHAQQCAEKYLKGMLVVKDQDFPKIHDLRRLNLLCESAGIFLSVDPELLDRLSLSAVQARYPGEDPTREEAREAVEIAKTVRKFARKFLGVK